MDVALLKIAVDSTEELGEEAERLDIKTPMLSDEDAEVTMAWVKDYAAPENGGLMYVEVEELRQEVSRRI